MTWVKVSLAVNVVELVDAAVFVCVWEPTFVTWSIHVGTCICHIGWVAVVSVFVLLQNKQSVSAEVTVEPEEKHHCHRKTRLAGSAQDIPAHWHCWCCRCAPTSCTFSQQPILEEVNRGQKGSSLCHYPSITCRHPQCWQQNFLLSQLLTPALTLYGSHPCPFLRLWHCLNDFHISFPLHLFPRPFLGLLFVSLFALWMAHGLTFNFPLVNFLTRTQSSGVHIF